MLSVVFLIFAAAGITVVVAQTLLGGLGGDLDIADDAGGHDLDPGQLTEGGHGGHGWLVGMLSLRSLGTAAAIFGLIGLACQRWDMAPLASVGVASLAGFVALVLVGQLMSLLPKLNASGSLRIARAVGQTGKVYLTVPAAYKGRGKVTLEVQSRTVELAAVTFGPELPTGTSVRVVQVVDPGTLEVVASPFGGSSHDS
ncbi:MAG: hypothetical protein ACFCVE_15175 [Phycisphaerae bacterium]